MSTTAGYRLYVKERSQKLREIGPQRLAQLTRYLSFAEYSRAFYVGANSVRINEDLDLDERLALYMNRGRKTDAHEQAWLDGNTWCDEWAIDFLYDKFKNPEQHT